MSTGKQTSTTFSVSFNIFKTEIYETNAYKQYMITLRINVIFVNKKAPKTYTFCCKENISIFCAQTFTIILRTSVIFANTNTP